VPNAVIFDVDGTLVASVDLHAKPWQDASSEYGRGIPFDDIRMQIGKGGDPLMPAFLSEDGIEAFGEELEARLGAILQDRYLPKVEAASQAGLRTIGLLCGGFPEDGLWEAGCIAVHRDPADLLAQYESSSLSDDGELAS